MRADTIAALSTAPGVGALAVVRVSGTGAGEVLARLLPPGVPLPAVRRATVLELRDPRDGERIDRAVVTRFSAPASFTGEDVVEISCHGGWLVPGLLLDACVRSGAREAEAGEFTRRAYLNGKLDLVQAEAIADLIGARSRALHRAAIGQLDRGLSERVSSMRSRLVRVEALLAHHLDFPEEDDAPVPIEEIAREAASLLRDLEELLATAPEGELLREGALVVFAGRPNAGKSSMYNALLGREGAIVTDEPGTTRDALEAAVQIGGWPFRLVDTAGLRDGAERVEALGIEVARRYLKAADVVLFCAPVGEPITKSEQEFLADDDHRPVLVLRTKADTLSSPGRGAPADRDLEGWDALRVSARSGEGLVALKERLAQLAYGTLTLARPDMPVVTRRRHADALAKARAEVRGFVAGLSEGLPAELAATHLRSAESALEDLIGGVTTDEVLDVVFREFCVGK